MRVADLVIDFLHSKGVNHAFTVSGGGCIHLIDALRQSPIETVCVHHEQCAVMGIEGYNRLSDNLAVAVVTTGPGGTNTMTGLLGLWLDSIPGIIISGQVSKSQLCTGTGCRQIGDQEFDIVNAVKSLTKYSVMVTEPSNVLYELQKAYHIATTGRPGPVWVDIPLDVQGSTIQDIKSDYTPRDTVYDNIDINKIQQLINNSNNPLIIAGNGIRLSKCFSTLHKFLHKTNIPIVTGPHSGVDVVDNHYKYYGGRIGILGQLTSNKIVQESDLLICLGTRLPVKMTGYNIKEFSPNSKKIIVDIDKNEINKHPFNFDLQINTDLKQFFSSIENINFKLSIGKWHKRVLSVRSEQEYYHQKHKNIKSYASFYYLISQAAQYFKQLPIITSNGTAHVITLQMYKINSGQRLFTNVGCASMGYGLPAAIGACFANKKRPVICIEGDGSIMMNIQELQTVAHYELPVKIIIINNDGYLSIKLTQESFFKGNEFASGPANGVTTPNYKDVAKAFKIDYHCIRTNDEIVKLGDVLSTNTPSIIEVFTHPKERHEPKVTHKGIDDNGKIIPGSLTDMYISDTY